MTVPRVKHDVRGRVTVRMRGGAPSPLVLEVAARVARSFHGEIHGVFIEHEELLALAGMPFAKEISLTGQRTRTLSPEDVRREMNAASAAMERKFAALTRTARIPAHFKVIRDVTEKGLREAIGDTGVLAIGEPVALAAPDIFPKLLADFSGFSGVVVAGCEAHRAKGPVLTVIDAAADVALLVDTAEKLAAEGAQGVILLLVGTGRDLERMEAEARAALDPGTTYRFERSELETPQTLASVVEDHSAGIVVARAGGPVAEGGREAVRFACSIPCPLLLLR